MSSGANFLHQAKQTGIIGRLLTFCAVHIGQYLLWLLSWFMIGRGILQGRLDTSWLLGWALLLITLIPLRIFIVWLQGQIAVRAGIILKDRLLVGALRLKLDEIQKQGIGQLLGRVIESEAVEALALNGGFAVLLSSIEIVFAISILSVGAAGGPHGLILIGWVIICLWLTWRYYQSRLEWTDTRLSVTHDLVEQMVGHRTRLAQLLNNDWHEEEDVSLANYLKISQHFDKQSSLLATFIAKGWLIIGTLGIAPIFINTSISIGLLAVSIGGILSAYQALQRLSSGLLHLVGAIIAWQQVNTLYSAAAKPQNLGLPVPTKEPACQSRNPKTLLHAHDLVYKYPNRHLPCMQGASLRIQTGDRVLLQGPSGGGKSTFASLLLGLRQPDAGLLLLGGLDHQTLGSMEWRKRIAAAPQFHENHVLTETFAFNLLMGRGWPPREEDIQEAIEVCNELGLADLLGRMPGGIFQMVGDTGWQLSHGEKSRLYIARAILQGADLIVLDESFAALDPENLQGAFQCVLQRAPALVVIAHP